MSADQHTTTITRRVYYADTDAGGVAYHATYVRWFEQARTEWLQARNHSHRDWHALGVTMVVAHLEINYRKPIYLDDEIVITATYAQQHRSGATFAHQITRGGQVCTDGSVRLVCVNLTDGRPTPVPEQLVHQL